MHAWVCAASCANPQGRISSVSKIRVAAQTWCGHGEKPRRSIPALCFPAFHTHSAFPASPHPSIHPRIPPSIPASLHPSPHPSIHPRIPISHCTRCGSRFRPFVSRSELENVPIWCSRGWISRHALCPPACTFSSSEMDTRYTKTGGMDSRNDRRYRRLCDAHSEF